MQNRDSLLIFLTGVVIFTIGLSSEFLGLDCRFALFAQEMLRNGPTLFPTTYGRPYPDYPAASTFMIYLASLPFGRVTRIAAALPVAVVSSLVMVMTYRIGAMRSRYWGLTAVLLELMTAEFIGLSRSLSPDQYVTLVTAGCFYLVYSTDFYGRPGRLWFVPLLFIAGFAFRGPLGTVIPAGVVCGYYLYIKNVRKLLIMAGSALAVLGLCSAGMLIAVKCTGGFNFMKSVFSTQVTGRMTEGGYNLAYYWYQSLADYAVAYPLALLVFIFRFKQIFRRANPDYKFLGCLLVWIFVIMAGMSIPGAKKMRYIAPMMPAAALVSAYIFINIKGEDFLSITKKACILICQWIPVIAFFIIAIMGIIDFYFNLGYEAYYLLTLFVMSVLAISGRWFNTWIKNQVFQEIALISIGVMTCIGIVVGVAEPINYNLNRTGPFVKFVESLPHQGEPLKIVFYKIRPDGDAIKFMVNLDAPVKPQFVDSVEAVITHQEPGYIIATEKDFDALPREHVRLYGFGKIGQTKCAVFSILRV